MKSTHRAAACLCVPAIGYVCHLHESAPEPPSPPPPADSPPPTAYAHRRACQDGGDGEEMITFDEENEAELLEAARLLLDVDWPAR